MPEAFYDAEFPKLRNEGWLQTSEPDNYNCIAFAVGDTTRFWWPNPHYPDPCDDYWPAGIPHEETVDAFQRMFESVRFVECVTADFESGYDKIALYALNGIPTHAAVLQENGKWRSKLGPHEDIETTLEGLSGPCYGSVVKFFKRPRLIG